jgi:hypothetical protein
MGKRSERWAAGEAKEVLARWKESGLALSRFEREEGLTSNRLRWWKQRLAGVEARAVTGPRFVPAVVTQVSMGAPVVVHAAGGVSIEVGDVASVPAQWLGAVVRELARG